MSTIEPLPEQMKAWVWAKGGACDQLIRSGRSGSGSARCLDYEQSDWTEPRRLEVY
jgi:hypothetical protein